MKRPKFSEVGVVVGTPKGAGVGAAGTGGTVATGAITAGESEGVGCATGVGAGGDEGGITG